MKKRLIIFTGILIFPLILMAKEPTITGNVYVHKGGGIVYIFLINENSYPVPIDTISFPVRYPRTNISFSLKNLKPGQYGIQCFQDINKNKSVDRNIFKRNEIVHFSGYKPNKTPKDFSQYSFDLKNDTTINLQLK